MTTEIDPYVTAVTTVRAGSTEACSEVTLKEFRPVIFLHVPVLFPSGVAQHQLPSHLRAIWLNLTVPPREGIKQHVRSFCSA